MLCLNFLFLVFLGAFHPSLITSLYIKVLSLSAPCWSVPFVPCVHATLFYSKSRSGLRLPPVSCIRVLMPLHHPDRRDQPVMDPAGEMIQAEMLKVRWKNLCPGWRRNGLTVESEEEDWDYEYLLFRGYSAGVQRPSESLESGSPRSRRHLSFSRCPLHNPCCLQPEHFSSNSAHADKNKSNTLHTGSIRPSIWVGSIMR